MTDSTFTKKLILMNRCEKLVDEFAKGRTGQFVHFEPYIIGEQLALGLANIAGYADDPKLVSLEVERLRKILARLL